MSKRKILYISLLSILALTAVLALNDFTAPASGMATCSPDPTVSCGGGPGRICIIQCGGWYPDMIAIPNLHSVTLVAVQPAFNL